MPLTVGTLFPVEIAVETSRGPLTIGDVLQDGPAVVAFHRAWCPFCQQAARELTAARDEIAALDAQVVIVYREDASTASGSCDERGVPFVCAGDPQRRLEHAVDVQKFSAARYWLFSPTRLVRALRGGSKAGRASSGMLQGRSTFVVGKDQRIVYAHSSRTAADIPDVDEILHALRGLRAANATGGSATRGPVG